MEDTPKGIQMQLNNLGRIISLRKEQGKSLSEVASAMEMTKEGWRQIEIAYNRTYQSAIERLKHPAEPEEINQIFQTINDYPFSIQQMENLNQLFGLSVKNAVPDSSGPIAFSPDDFLQKQLENAAHRDLRLTQDILECISICGESDLQLLRQTITLLVKRDSSFQHSLSSMVSPSAVSMAACRFSHSCKGILLFRNSHTVTRGLSLSRRLRSRSGGTPAWFTNPMH